MPTTFIILSAAVLCLWLSSCYGDLFLGRKLWFVIFLTALASGVVEHFVTPVGVIAVILFGAVVFTFARSKLQWLRVTSAAIVTIFAVALMIHRVPGFRNPVVIEGVKFSSDARPFTLYLNFDKTMVGLFILGWLHPRINNLRDWKLLLKTWLLVSAGLVVLLMGLSLACGYVRWAPKVPVETWLWMLVNLLFVCTAEEAFFRGFIQAQLQRLWRHRHSGASAALATSSALFGLAHFQGGWTYVALAAVAGLGYGWIYQRTQRIEASILAHFTLNTVHFLLFTYPAVQPAT